MSQGTNFFPDRSRTAVSTLHEWTRHEDVSDRLFMARIPTINFPATTRGDTNTALLLPEPPLSPKSVTSIVPFSPSSISGASAEHAVQSSPSDAGETTYSAGDSSLPGMTSSSTIQTISELGDVEMAPIQGVLQLIPDGVEVDRNTLPSPTFKCRFWFLNCSYATPNEAEWKTHNLAHFHGNQPPRGSTCPLCDMTFNIPDPLVSWAANMSHLAQHFKEGLTLATGRPDFVLFKHLWSQRIICDVDYQELMGNYHLRHGRRPYVVMERRDRRERRGLPMPQSRM